MDLHDRHAAAFLPAAQGLALLERWLDEQPGLRLMLLTLPPGSTLDDALREHRALRQLGRRPSRCMAVDGGSAQPAKAPCDAP